MSGDSTSSVLPTARELEALKVLWRLGEATVRDVYNELRAQQPQLAYTTILSLMQTMEKKGLAKRKSQGRGKTHYYTAGAAAESTLRRMAGQFLDKVFDGAVGQYLVRALEARRPTVEELDELEQMIAEAKKNLKRKRK